MKNIIFILIFVFGFSANAQVKFKESAHQYQYQTETISNDKPISFYKRKLIEYGFTDFVEIDKTLFAKSFFTKMIYGSAMEIHYSIKIDEGPNKTEITFSNFKITDVRYGTTALEELKKKAQLRWIEEIDKRIPDVLDRLNNNN